MDDLRNGRFRSFAAGQWPFSQCTYVGESRPIPDRFVISRMDNCLFIAVIALCEQTRCPGSVALVIGLTKSSPTWPLLLKYTYSYILCWIFTRII